jgi:membrane protein implicated in regulation of membrane protease activity
MFPAVWRARARASRQHSYRVLLLGAILLAIYVLPSPWGWLVVFGAAVVEVAEVFFWIWLSRRRAIQMGPEALIGAYGEAVTPCQPEGQIRIAGELWQARCEAGAEAGERVRVVGREGLTLDVERASADSSPGESRP